MDRSNVISVRLEPSLKAVLLERAEVEGRTLNSLVTRTLANATKRWNNKTAGASTPTAASKPVGGATNGTTQPHRRRAGKSAAD